MDDVDKKLKFKSMKQVRGHVAKFGPEDAESKAHEAKESRGFEKAEHKVYKSMGKGAK